MNAMLDRQAGLKPALPLVLVHADCGGCGADDPEPVAVGMDFEHHTSDDTFLMVRCRVCSQLYLNPRPADREHERVLAAERLPRPAAARQRSLVERVRRRLVARRLLNRCRREAPGARIFEVDCGDEFHLDVLREFAPRGYRVDGASADAVAQAAFTRGQEPYDVAFAIHALEQSGSPAAVLAEIAKLLRPGGRLIVVTNNAQSFACRVFGRRYWGGYEFPRYRNLFTPQTLARLAIQSGWRVAACQTLGSPFSWVASIRNALRDARAPEWLARRFTNEAPEALVFFALLDVLAARVGYGALLCTTLEPAEATAP